MYISTMNYREIDLNLLMILDAMYDAGSTTLVAERLKVSQPTVSFSLGKLRDVFGDELFVRHGASMQPTPLAQSIREPVRRVIETVRFDILRERAFDPASAERTLRAPPPTSANWCSCPCCWSGSRSAHRS